MLPTDEPDGRNELVRTDPVPTTYCRTRTLKMFWMLYTGLQLISSALHAASSLLTDNLFTHALDIQARVEDRASSLGPAGGQIMTKH